MTIDILAFSPHPDDAEIGCGGLLLLAAREGLKTAIVDLSEGEKSTRGTPAVRGREKAEAGALLGLSVRDGLGLPDSRIGRDAEHEAAVVACLRKHRPRIVLAPPREDRHPDHEEAARLVRRAVFFAGVEKVGTDAPHRIERLLHYGIHTPFQPSLVFDVGSVWTDRMNVLAAYRSQFGDTGDDTETALSGGRLQSVLEARARHYGAMIGARYGEPYLSPGPLRFDRPSDLLSPDGADRAYLS